MSFLLTNVFQAHCLHLKFGFQHSQTSEGRSLNVAGRLHFTIHKYHVCLPQSLHLPVLLEVDVLIP